MSVADDPTIGEVVRGLADLRRSVDQLSGKVLTVEVWKAEKESMDFRMRENEKDIATLDADAKAERKQRELEKLDADKSAKALRTQFVFAILTAVIAPILVGVVLAATLKG